MLSTERAVMQRLLGEESTIAEVARRLGRSRQTIYNWINKEEQPVRRTRMSKLDPYRAYIKSRLERFDLPVTVLLSELRAKGYDGGITILRDFAAKIKKRHVRRLVDRFETEPGRQAQVDWASCGTIIHEGRRPAHRGAGVFADDLGRVCGLRAPAGDGGPAGALFS